jgi:hypothetical protein
MSCIVVIVANIIDRFQATFNVEETRFEPKPARTAGRPISWGCLPKSRDNHLKRFYPRVTASYNECAGFFRLSHDPPMTSIAELGWLGWFACS